MKNYYLIFLMIGLSFGSSLFAQRDTIYEFGDDPGETEYYFGFSLIENSMGGLIHLVLYKPEQDGTHKVKQLTKDDFIAQASGKQESIANPNGIDFFKKFQIDDPSVMDNLWRLRYKEYPYFTNQQMEPGWSANDSIPFLPTESQMQILQKFGLYRINDIIYGENAFRLLSLIGKPEWVLSYKESY